MKFSNSKMSDNRSAANVVTDQQKVKDCIKDVDTMKQQITTMSEQLRTLVAGFEGLQTNVKTVKLEALISTFTDLSAVNGDFDTLQSKAFEYAAQGEETNAVIIDAGTVVYAKTENSHIVILWISDDYFFSISDSNDWIIDTNGNLARNDGENFQMFYTGKGAGKTTATERFYIIPEGTTVYGHLNYTDVSSSVVVDFFKAGTAEIDTLTVKNVETTAGVVTGEKKLVTKCDNTEGLVTVSVDELNEYIQQKIAETLHTFTAKQTLADTDVNGTLNVNGAINQNGSAYETHAEKLYTKKDKVITRDGAVAGLGAGELTGLQAHKYDGTHEGVLGFDKDGVARVGDAGDEQPLATRAEASQWSNGDLAKWDSASQKFVPIANNFAEKADINLINGKIPDTATSENKLVDTSALNVALTERTVAENFTVESGFTLTDSKVYKNKNIGNIQRLIVQGTVKAGEDTIIGTIPSGFRPFQVIRTTAYVGEHIPIECVIVNNGLIHVYSTITVSGNIIIDNTTYIM